MFTSDLTLRLSNQHTTVTGRPWIICDKCWFTNFLQCFEKDGELIFQMSGNCNRLSSRIVLVPPLHESGNRERIGMEGRQQNRKNRRSWWVLRSARNWTSPHDKQTCTNHTLLIYFTVRTNFLDVNSFCLGCINTVCANTQWVQSLKWLLLKCIVMNTADGLEPELVPTHLFLSIGCGTVEHLTAQGKLNSNNSRLWMKKCTKQQNL